jgi:hypothetical protein
MISVSGGANNGGVLIVKINNFDIAAVSRNRAAAVREQALHEGAVRKPLDKY